jgi:hypothetical protein
MKLLLLIVVMSIAADISAGQERLSSWHSEISRITEEEQEQLAARDRDFADGALPDPLPRERAFAILLNTRTFANEAVGRAGLMSNQVRAFQVLIAQGDAKVAFADLLQRGTKEGKLYGLCGLFLTDQSMFTKEYPRFVNFKDEVNTQFGCVSSKTVMGQVIGRRKVSGDGATTYDIVNGGIPEAFARRKDDRQRLTVPAQPNKAVNRSRRWRGI